MANLGGEFSFFRGIQVSIDLIIDISIFIKPATTKFGKQVDQLTHQMRLIKQVLIDTSATRVVLRDHATK